MDLGWRYGLYRSYDHHGYVIIVCSKSEVARHSQYESFLQIDHKMNELLSNIGKAMLPTTSDDNVIIGSSNAMSRWEDATRLSDNMTLGYGLSAWSNEVELGFSGISFLFVSHPTLSPNKGCYEGETIKVSAFIPSDKNNWSKGLPSLY